MEPRVDYTRVAPGALHAMLGLSKYLSQSGLEPALLDLVNLRASQINGCAYCIDMHWKDLARKERTSSGSTASTRGPSLPIAPTASAPRWRGRKR